MTRTEYKILSKIIDNQLSDEDIDKFKEEINSLIRNGKISVSLRAINKMCAANLTVTKSGISDYEDYTEKRREQRNGWVKYWITTAISIIALITSIFALIKP